MNTKVFWTGRLPKKIPASTWSSDFAKRSCYSQKLFLYMARLDRARYGLEKI